ncbi:hypothetical protein ACTWP5_11835 [Streptomyces sp. 4N509B]|uniref:hypothetical protein n=1 Tax=Streptomyces sp. 4N509B TaxID=3457413 RepID=UPI003FD2B7F6
MRRSATTCATLTAAAALALSLPGSASAADGKLIINGQSHKNPRGCYASDASPLTVENGTNERVLVFAGEKCDGGFVEAVYPDESTVSVYGKSLYVG